MAKWGIGVSNDASLLNPMALSASELPNVAWDCIDKVWWLWSSYSETEANPAAETLLLSLLLGERDRSHSRTIWSNPSASTLRKMASVSSPVPMLSIMRLLEPRSSRARMVDPWRAQ